MTPRSKSAARDYSTYETADECVPSPVYMYSCQAGTLCVGLVTRYLNPAGTIVIGGTLVSRYVVWIFFFSKKDMSDKKSESFIHCDRYNKIKKKLKFNYNIMRNEEMVKTTLAMCVHSRKNELNRFFWLLSLNWRRGVHSP